MLLPLSTSAPSLPPLLFEFKLVIVEICKCRTMSAKSQMKQLQVPILLWHKDNLQASVCETFQHVFLEIRLHHFLQCMWYTLYKTDFLPTSPFVFCPTTSPAHFCGPCAKQWDDVCQWGCYQRSACSSVRANSKCDSINCGHIWCVKTHNVCMWLERKLLTNVMIPRLKMHDEALLGSLRNQHYLQA